MGNALEAIHRQLDLGRTRNSDGHKCSYKHGEGRQEQSDVEPCEMVFVGVFEDPISQGIVKSNPVSDAKWRVPPATTPKQKELLVRRSEGHPRDP